MYVDQGATVPTHGMLKGHHRTHPSTAERKPSEGQYFNIWQTSILGYTVDMMA